MRRALMLILLGLFLAPSCIGQVKKPKKAGQIKTDTVDVFQRFDEDKFNEKNIFWIDTKERETGIIQDQRFNTKTYDASYSIKLTVIFYNLDSIELDKRYDISLLTTECIKKTTFGGEIFTAPTGYVQLVTRLPDRLTFYFNVESLSTDKKTLLIYRGERTFRPDY
ncbi:MAG TPA: hypothetical protein VFE50_16495 [Cyclobacteriaceae bacterium]|nr:hypothetical protein [Cyclobacteriaceae bacterium]